MWLRGEVANWTASARGHRYFTLRDDRAQVDCVLFQGDAWRLPTDPEDGMEIVAFGQPTLYPARGRFQVVVRILEAAGEGLWRLAFEQLRRTLEAEGLLAPERKRALPAFPRRLGVVTSKQGAALRDVRQVLAPLDHVSDASVARSGRPAEALDQLQRRLVECRAGEPALEQLVLG